MASHSTSSVQETADPLAIGELIDAYTHCVARRDARGQTNLFHRRHPFCGVPGWECQRADAGIPRPGGSRLGSRRVEYLRCHVSFHRAARRVRGGGPATGQSYCLAHHLSVSPDGQRTMMIAAIRYLDTSVKQDGAWLFAERRLMVDWTETRPSSA
jgi:SnoaL-like domain